MLGLVLVRTSKLNLTILQTHNILIDLLTYSCTPERKASVPDIWHHLLSASVLFLKDTSINYMITLWVFGLVEYQIYSIRKSATTTAPSIKETFIRSYCVDLWLVLSLTVLILSQWMNIWTLWDIIIMIGLSRVKMLQLSFSLSETVLNDE